MNKLLTTIAFSLGTTLCIYAQSDTKSVEIINKVIKAAGGKKNLENVKTLYSEMQINNDPVFYITREEAPNKGALEVKVNGNSVYGYRFDGSKGFENNQGKITAMPEEDIADKKNRKYIMNELAYLDPTIWTFNFIGEVNINNKKAYKLKGKNENGIVEYIYFDANTFYKIRKEMLIDNNENKVTTFEYSDYRDVNGVKLNFKTILIDPDKNTTTMTTTIQEINKGITAKDFVY